MNNQQELLNKIKASINDYCDTYFDFGFNPEKPAVRLHEIVPRSLDRLWYNHPENSVPLCDPCHQWAGGAGKAGRAELCKLRDNLPRPDKSTAV